MDDHLTIETHTNGKVEHRDAKGNRFTLLAADAKMVRDYWPTLIRPGLETIKKGAKRSNGTRSKPKDPRSGLWVPEHVRACVEAGLAGRLFCECYFIMSVSKPDPVGFLVYRLYNDEAVQVPLRLFVWIAYSIDMRALDEVMPLVERRARELGLRGVEGVSSRWAWIERLKKHGYIPHQVIIRKDFYPEE